MAYGYNKQTQVIGDLVAADDPERNTKIEFGNDRISFYVGGTLVASITPSQLSASLFVGDGSSLEGVSNASLTNVTASAINDTTSSFNISNVQDGQFLKRSGNSIVGSFIMMVAVGVANETEVVRSVGTANDTLTGIYAFSGTAVLA